MYMFKYCAIEPKLELCTEEEFNNFIKEYPNKLYEDFFLEVDSFNDFVIGWWPYCIVAAKTSTWSEDGKDKYRIARNYKEVLASVVKE